MSSEKLHLKLKNDDGAFEQNDTEDLVELQEDDELVSLSDDDNDFGESPAAPADGKKKLTLKNSSDDDFALEAGGGGSASQSGGVEELDEEELVAVDNVPDMPRERKLLGMRLQSALDANAFLNMSGSASEILKLMRKLSRSKNANENLLRAFSKLQRSDGDYLQSLDLLHFVGKKRTELVSKPLTLSSPGIDCEGCPFMLAGEHNEFVYALEKVMKVYVFEHEVSFVQVYWDYVNKMLFNETCKTFYFDDITNYTTSYAYRKILNKVSLSDVRKKYVVLLALLFVIPLLAFLFLGFHQGGGEGLFKGFLVGCFTGAILHFSALLGLYAWEQAHAPWVRQRVMEELSIESSSGSAQTLSVMCSDWIEAQSGCYVRISGPEKTFRAIRKMIHEKKCRKNG